MAILWADSFDDWSNTSGIAGEYEAYNTGGNNPLTAGAGRRGTNALTLNAFTAYAQKTLSAPSSELFVSVAHSPAGINGTAVLVFMSGSTSMITLRMNADGSISVLRGALGSTVLGSSAAGLVSIGTYTHFQIRVVFSATVGVVQVRINGSTTPAINLSGQNTNGASANAVQLYAGGSGASHWDDFVISDTSGSIANTWLGDVRVDSYLPNGNGDLSQMVGSDGNSTDNYALVNAAAPSASSYVQSDVVGAEDLYQVANMAHDPSSVLGVLVTAAALKDDAGTRAIRLHAKSGTTDARSAADINLGTGRARVHTLFETDPNTSAAWTKSAIDAAQFGVEVTV